MLTTHDDDSVTMTEKRNHVCLKASWELEALSELLTMVSMHGSLETNAQGYQVRCISSRVKLLAKILMSGLSDDVAPTDDLEGQLKA